MSESSACDVIADDLIIMFLAMERIQSHWSSSVSPGGDVNDASLVALSRLLTENPKVDAKRFAIFVCICKEMWWNCADTNSGESASMRAKFWKECIKAAEQCHFETVKLLLEKEGADVSCKNEHGNTVLMRAAIQGDFEIVKLLLEKGADACHANSDGDTVLIFAAKYGHSEIVKLLLEKEGVDVSRTNNHGDTAWMLAARRGHSEIVKLLLEKEDADVSRTNNHGDTALMLAAQQGHLEIVKLLLEKEGAYVSRANNDGDTALLLAARNGRNALMSAARHSLIEKLLLEKGADASRENDYGNFLAAALKWQQSLVVHKS